MLNSKIERIKTNGHEKEKEKYGEACVYIFLLSVQFQNLSCQCLAAIYNARDKRENSIIFRSSPCLTALLLPPSLSFVPPLFFFFAVYIYFQILTL